MAIGWWIVSAVTSVLFIIYLGFFWRMNWIQDLATDDAKSSWFYGRTQGDSGRRGSRKKQRKVGPIPPVYPNGWFALLESSQLKCGEVKHITAIGQNFAVFRTENGVASVLDAYCPHLGANMAEGGKVQGECLECPFHGWLFKGTDGQCTSIPYSVKVPDFAKAKSWECCEVNHRIFVWHHAENVKPYWRPQPVENISNGRWRYQGRNEFLVSSHIQDIPENGADWTHLSVVHGPSMLFNYQTSWLARHSWTDVNWTPYPSGTTDTESSPSAKVEKGAKVEAGTETERSIKGEESEDEKRTDDQSHRATIRLRHTLMLFERVALLKLSVRAEQMGPGYVELFVQTSLGELCILQAVTPLEPLLQRVTHIMFAPPLISPLATLILFGESVMFERDVAVWNYKRFEQRPLLVPEDRSILAYRRWYSQFYSPNSPTYQSAKESLEW